MISPYLALTIPVLLRFELIFPHHLLMSDILVQPADKHHSLSGLTYHWELPTESQLLLQDIWFLFGPAQNRFLSVNPMPVHTEFRFLPVPYRLPFFHYDIRFLHLQSLVRSA